MSCVVQCRHPVGGQPCKDSLVGQGMALELDEALEKWQKQLAQSTCYWRLRSGEEEQYWESHADQYWRNRTSGPHFTLVLDWLKEVVPPQATLLEIGPGPGIFTLSLANHCRVVTAIEPSPAVVKHLRRQADGFPNLAIIQSTWEDCVVSPHDLVFGAGVVYFFSDPKKSLEKMLRSARQKVLLVLVDEADSLSQELAAILQLPPPPPAVPATTLFFQILEQLVPSYICTKIVGKQIYHYPDLSHLVNLWYHDLKLFSPTLLKIESFLKEKGIVITAEGNIAIPRNFISYLLEVDLTFQHWSGKEKYQGR